MFFDTALWQFTRGVRLRITYAVLIGVLAADIGGSYPRSKRGNQWILAVIIRDSKFGMIVCMPVRRYGPVAR